MILPHITQSLRFPDRAIDCVARCTLAEGKPAPAIHRWDGVPLCAAHSPVDDLYVPCTNCGERPAYKPENVEEDPLCQPCLRILIEKVAELQFLGERDDVDPSHTPAGIAPDGLGAREHAEGLCPECGELMDMDNVGRPQCPNRCDL